MSVIFLLEPGAKDSKGTHLWRRLLYAAVSAAHRPQRLFVPLCGRKRGCRTLDLQLRMQIKVPASGVREIYKSRLASCAPKKARTIIWPRSVHSVHTGLRLQGPTIPSGETITPLYLHIGRVVCDEQLCVQIAPHVPGQVVILAILSFRTEQLHPRAMRETSQTEIDDLRQSHSDISLPCSVRDVAYSGQGTLSAVTCLRYIGCWGPRLIARHLFVSPRHVWVEALRSLALVRPYGFSNRMCTA